MAFELPKLPYDYNALEPYMDTKTMEVHHDKHHAGYTKKLNAALENNPEFFKKSIVEILSDLNMVPEAIRTTIRNNGGGYYHHNIWWEQFGPGKGGKPSGALANAINEKFGSFEEFQAEFKKTALDVFGSGWAWLVQKDGKLDVISTSNADTPIAQDIKPLLTVDVWEHAYYLDYQNKRADYLESFIKNLINWDFVNINIS